MNANLRFGIFVVVGAFLVLGPIETQVLKGPARSTKRWWLPMRWQMYQGAGVNYCQAQVHAMHDGARMDFTPDTVLRAVGRGVSKSRHRTERFAMGRKARASDIVFSSEGDLAGTVKALCEGEKDVRAEMRCSPAYPGGKWRHVEDGATNLCERTKWSSRAPAPGPNLDPETGELIEAEELEP